MGRDRIGHPANAHDDLSNAAAGALVLAASSSSYWSNGMAWKPTAMGFRAVVYNANTVGLANYLPNWTDLEMMQLNL